MVRANAAELYRQTADIRRGLDEMPPELAKQMLPVTLDAIEHLSAQVDILLDALKRVYPDLVVE